MPNIDVSSANIRSRQVSRVRLPAGAFQAEFRAQEQAGRQTGRLAQTLGAIGARMTAADELRQVNAAQTATDKFIDDWSLKAATDTDFATQRERFDEEFEAFSADTRSQTSGRASGIVASQLDRAQSSWGTRFEIRAHGRLMAEERANSPQANKSSIDREAVENVAERGTEWKLFIARLNALDANGQLAQTGRWSREGRIRARTIQKAQTDGIISSKDAVLMLGSKADMVESGEFNKEEVDSLTDEDMKDLKEVAEKQVAAQRADVDNAEKDRNERVARDFQAKIVDPKVPIAKTQQEFLTAVRAGILEKTQISGLDSAINSRISNAGKTADPEEIARSTDEYEKLEENGKLDEAHAVAMRDAWMHTEAVTRGRLEEIAEARANPSKQSTDPSLKEFISISENMESQMTAVLKAQTDEEKLDEAGQKEFRESTAVIGLNRLNRNAKLRDIYSRTDIDEKKKRELAQEIVLPAQQEAAKAVTRSIWKRAFAFQRRFTPFGAVEGIISTFQSGKVRVRKPDGTIGTVSKKNLKEAQDAGFTVIE